MNNIQYTNSDYQLHLSHFTLENLHEAVFWIDSRQKIIQVNEMASKMSGYSKEELSRMRVTDINPSSEFMNWAAFWQRLKKEKKLVFESQHKHKSGYLYDIEITGNFIELDGQEFSCSIVRDIREKNVQEQLARKHLSEMELYNSTVKNIRDQIFWVEKNGKLIRANEAVSRESGYTSAELSNMTVFDLNPSLTEEEWDKGWVQTKQDGQMILETEHRDKEGNFYPVEVTNNFIEHAGIEYFCSSVRDIRKRKQEEGILLAIAESTSALTGEDYFRELTKFITGTLNVQYSMVVSCSDADVTKLRMLSYVDRKEIKENIEYDLHGTPCEIVMQGKEFFCADKLDETFPRERGIKSWVAVPIYSPATNKVIGNIAAFDRIPMVNEQNHLAILRIFASRAGAEIDRIKAEEKLTIANANLKILLKESEERFRDLFEEAPIAYVHEGLDSRFIKANRAALNILGVKPEEVPYMVGKDMAPKTPDAQRRMKEAFESVGRGTDTSGVVLELLRHDNGQPIWIQWWSNPDVGGQFTRTMFIDITDKVLMEREQARLQAQNQYLREEIKLNNNFEEIISKSKNFQKVLQQLEKVASTDATVLILGESGTGKELLARAVHNISNRSKRPLVKVNCATLPTNLIESELFGHEKGAFTGAMDKKIGRFELADGGTIFLDEIAELPVELQAKLLRVLQEGEFERLGNPRTMKVNVRVIAATNRNLEQAIEKKEFREDLFYRLNVFPIISPPLRDRKEDIPLLVKHFCQKHEAKIGKKIIHIEPEVTDALMEYNWPGNIREVENLIERAMIISHGNTLEYGDWLPVSKNSGSNQKSTLLKLEDVEKEHIIDILKKTNWKISGEKGAAKLLGLNATTLEARMKKMGIKREA
jgi:formate hydrogenlyase transcriptional activator